MEHENNQTGSLELSAETIATQITTELAKVVDIDQDLLQRYVAFLRTMPGAEVESLLGSLKTTLDERLLPLLTLIAHDPKVDFAEYALGPLGAIHSLKAAQCLSDLNETHPDKKIRKAARRSLYKLKSAGIEVETTLKPLLGEVKHTPYKTLMSAVDGTGSQLMILSEEMLAGDLHLLQVIANDEKGIVEAFSRRGITKKMFTKLPETFARELANASPMMVEADAAYVFSRLLELEALNATTAQDVPEDYSAMREFFGLDQAQTGLPNPIYTLLDVANLKEQPYFLRTSEDLFKQQAFLGWLLPINEMGDFAQQLLDQEDSVIELSPQFQQERKEEIYQKIVEAKFGADVIARLQRRLEIMAYIFFLQKQEESSKQALAAALALADTSAPALKGHPFIRKLILDSITIAQDVIEDGFNPEDYERDDYIVYRDEEGKLVVDVAEHEE